MSVWDGNPGPCTMGLNSMLGSVGVSNKQKELLKVQGQVMTSSELLGSTCRMEQTGEGGRERGRKEDGRCSNAGRMAGGPDLQQYPRAGRAWGQAHVVESTRLGEMMGMGWGGNSWRRLGL